MSTAGRGAGWRQAFRLARRELRAGLGGFYVFIACVALGVMVITAVGALTDALRAGFARQGEAILGGDATFARMHARASETERAWLALQGRISESGSMRAIARRVDGTEQALVELKGVDRAYPLAGTLRLTAGASLDMAVHDGAVAAADPALLERLRVKPGDHLEIGELDVEVRAAVLAEPDAIADRLTYGPRVLVSLDTLSRTGLVKPGALVRWRYAVKLPGRAGERPAALASLREAAGMALPESGFTITDRRDPSPQVSKTLERLRQFLTLIGLTALLTGGVGVANAVSTFLDKRRKVIATMRSLGATNRMVFAVFFAQVMTLAAIGVGAGLSLGLAIPPLVSSAYGDALQIEAELSVSVGSLVTAAAYGFLVAVLFALWPLGRAERFSAAALFRDEVAEVQGRPRQALLVVMAALAAALAAAAVLMSESHAVALAFCGGLVLVFLVFAGLGSGVTMAARRMKRPRRPELALAIGNIGAPDGLTRSVILSLGTGLTLLATVALAHAALVEELTSRMPAESPNYFVLDVPKSDFEPLSSLILREAPAAKLHGAPMLRWRLLRLGDKSVEDIKAPPEAQWVLTGDRGLTYSETVPEGSRLVKGEWWPKDYAGEPLVSFESELAQKLGVGIGRSVTVNVLGRNVTARIANLREVKWESLALNFVMVFSPNTLANAPHNVLATITLPKETTLAAEIELARTLGRAYPAVTAIRVKDAIETFNAIFSKVMTAVRIAGGVTLLAGALVLAGALATAQRRRVLEAVILKTLGATRRRIIGAHLAEYALLALATAGIAVVLGSIAAWVAVERIMEIEFSYSWRAVLEALGLAFALVMAFGGIGTWLVLKARPVPTLRSE